MSNGVKYDDEKLDFTLLPYDSLCEVVKVLMYGAKKYPEADNWKRVGDARKRYNKAALRHTLSEVSGETIDPESKLYHLAHAVCSNMFALSFALKENNKKARGICNYCRQVMYYDFKHECIPQVSLD